MTQRIKATHDYGTEGRMAIFGIYDSVDQTLLLKHSFEHRDDSVWIEANRRIAQSIASALNASPRGAIEQMRMAARTAGRLASRGLDLALAA